MGKKDTDDRGASVDDNKEAVDEFEQAFDVAIEGGTAGEIDDSITDGTAAEGGTSGEINNAGTSGNEGSDDQALTDGTAGTASKVEDYEQKYKTLQGIFKTAKSDWENEKTKLLSKQTQEKSPTDQGTDGSGIQTPVDKRAAFMATLTDEQKDQLKEYEKEFAVISKMEGIKREYELDSLKKEFGEFIVSKLNEIVLPMAQEIDRTTEKGHFSFLRERHPDFEEHRDSGAILEWIEGKPVYLRNSLKAIYEEGEAEDIVDLITDFKRENNLLADSSKKTDTEAAAQAAEAERQRKAELEAKRTKKKDALASVDTSKTAIATQQGVATDFEDAFDEALAAQS